MKQLFLILSTLLFLPTLLQASELDILSVQNASNVSVNGNGDYHIFGGVAGATSTCDVLSSNQTCNNCTQPNQACNENRIHDDLLLKMVVMIQPDAGVNTEPLIVQIDNSAAERNDLSIVSQSGGQYSDGNWVSFTLKWSDICDSYDSNSGFGLGCEGDSFHTELYISIGTAKAKIDITVHRPEDFFFYGADLLDCTVGDPTPSGICFFHAYPGDGKVYITDLVVLNDYPNNGIVRFTGMRVFISNQSFADANYTSKTYTDLIIPEGQEEPEPNIVDGLMNGITYWFRSAMIDEAGNIAYLQDPESIDNVQASCLAFVDTPGDTLKDPLCDMMATPMALKK